MRENARHVLRLRTPVLHGSLPASDKLGVFQTATCIPFSFRHLYAPPTLGSSATVLLAGGSLGDSRGPGGLEARMAALVYRYVFLMDQFYEAQAHEYHNHLEHSSSGGQ